jgi:hypothetical protein
MENSDKKVCACGGSCGGNCEGGSCGGMHMHGCHCGKHHFLKVIFKLVILIIIFWCGFQLGEMTGFIRGEYGRGAMGGGFGTMRSYGNPSLAPTQ